MLASAAAAAAAAEPLSRSQKLRDPDRKRLVRIAGLKSTTLRVPVVEARLARVSIPSR